MRDWGIKQLEGSNLPIVIKTGCARQLIIRVSDQLKAGEISLIEVTPKEAQAAKARLDAHNAKRRERYDWKQKQSNKTTHRI